MRYLVTGHKGYIGSDLTRKLLKLGHEVIGIDNGYFEDCKFDNYPLNPPFKSIKKDLRDIVEEDLKGIDTVFHLAALSNDPIGNLNSKWTDDINNSASLQLAKFSKSIGVPKFIFSSSCIMYGESDLDVVDETSPVDPKTDYAKSKVAAEKEILKLADSKFAPVSLRNGTVYGLSEFMRFDTVTNDFVGSAMCTGKIIIKGNGKPWRPVVYVGDISRSFIEVSKAPLNLISGEIFNNGTNELNIQIFKLAEVVANIIKGTKVEVLEKNDEDQRTYKASFNKLKNYFPDFKFEFDPYNGVKKLYEEFQNIGLNKDDYLSGKFIRLKNLTRLVEDGLLDNNLSWINKSL